MRPVLLLFVVFPNWLFAQTPEVALVKGLIIKESCRIKPAPYNLQGDTADVFLRSYTFQKSVTAVVTISGENLSVDFQKAELRGTAPGQLPNTFYGLAILIKGKNITSNNARANGYKVALLVDGVEGLTLAT